MSAETLWKAKLQHYFSCELSDKLWVSLHNRVYTSVSQPFFELWRIFYIRKIKLHFTNKYVKKYLMKDTVVSIY